MVVLVVVDAMFCMVSQQSHTLARGKHLLRYPSPPLPYSPQVYDVRSSIFSFPLFSLFSRLFFPLPIFLVLILLFRAQGFKGGGLPLDSFPKFKLCANRARTGSIRPPRPRGTRHPNSGTPFLGHWRERSGRIPVEG